MGCQCFVSCEDDAKDVLAHYLECPILWTVINSAALTLQRPQEGSAECRACLCNPTLNDFKRLVVAFNVYHSLRLGHRTVVDSAIRSCKYDGLLTLLLDLTRYYVNEVALHQVV